MAERTFEYRLRDPWGNELPDDPASWTADELSAALYESGLRHAAWRVCARGKRQRLELTERECVAVVLRLCRQEDDALAKRTYGVGASCVRCWAYQLGYPLASVRDCTSCIPF